MTLPLLFGGGITPPPPPPPVIPGDTENPDGSPILESYARELRRMLEPALYGEPTNDWAGAKLISAVAAPFQEIEDLARDVPDTRVVVVDEGLISTVVRTRGRPGWSVVMDPDLIPDKALPWLAQFVGVTIPRGVSEPVIMRQLITSVSGFRRGSPGAMIAAAQVFLTGQKRVLFREQDGSAYRITVITYAAETPDPVRVLAALQAQKPAGLALFHQVYEGQDYLKLRTDNADYQAVKDNFATYADVRANQ